MNLINVGCGSLFHPDWINLDFAPASARVRACDIRRGLPCDDSSADVVYHSHVLEHLTPEAGVAFLRECFRVLRPGGVIRVVVPDLEGLARAYLKAVEAGEQFDPELHFWLRLELFDQFERERSGGRVAEFVGGLDSVGLAKVRNRIGTEVEALVKAQGRSQRSWWERVRSAGWRRLVRRGHVAVARAVLRIWGGRKMADALAVGLFRAGGEVHRAAYDRLALAAVLRDAGFAEIRVVRATESRVANFASYRLDVLDGQVRKPDSLFMEASKP